MNVTGNSRIAVAAAVSLVLAVVATPTWEEEYQLVGPASCDLDPAQALKSHSRLIKTSVRELATRCNKESTDEGVLPNHHDIVVDPSVPDEYCFLAPLPFPPGGLRACGSLIKSVLAGNGLAPIQESASVVRIVPLSSVKPGQPLADMSW
jgi:hypothetical protein